MRSTRKMRGGKPKSKSPLVTRFLYPLNPKSSLQAAKSISKKAKRTGNFVSPYAKSTGKFLGDLGWNSTKNAGKYGWDSTKKAANYVYQKTPIPGYMAGWDPKKVAVLGTAPSLGANTGRVAMGYEPIGTKPPQPPQPPPPVFILTPFLRKSLHIPPEVTDNELYDTCNRVEELFKQVLKNINDCFDENIYKKKDIKALSYKLKEMLVTPGSSWVKIDKIHKALEGSVDWIKNHVLDLGLTPIIKNINQSNPFIKQLFKGSFDRKKLLKDADILSWISDVITDNKKYEESGVGWAKAKQKGTMKNKKKKKTTEKKKKKKKKKSKKKK